jgi:predicted nucleotidyltransferase
MDVLDEELLHFWRILNRNEVKYIMVGGFAVNMQGFSRATSDADLWLKDEVLNRKNLRKAFVEMGHGDIESLETMEFIPGWTQFNIGGGITLDILTFMKGLEDQSFDDCLEKANVADFEGVKVPFLHINDLISNKKAVFRPKDQLDLIELEKIRKIRQESEQKKTS